MPQTKGIFRKAMDAMMLARQRSAQRYVDTYLDNHPDHRHHGQDLRR